MFVVLIDRLRRRVMVSIRIIFLLALVAVLVSQLYGLIATSRALSFAQQGVDASSLSKKADGFINNFVRDLRYFYQGS